MIITYVDICDKFYGSEEASLERGTELQLKRQKLGWTTEAFYEYLKSMLDKEPNSPFYLEELFIYHIGRFELSKAGEIVDLMVKTGLFTERMIRSRRNKVEMKDYNSRMQVYIKMFFSNDRSMKKMIPSEYLKEIEDFAYEGK